MSLIKSGFGENVTFFFGDSNCKAFPSKFNLELVISEKTSSLEIWENDLAGIDDGSTEWLGLFLNISLISSFSIKLFS